MEGSVRAGGGKGVCNGLMVMGAMSLLPQVSHLGFSLDFHAMTLTLTVVPP